MTKILYFPTHQDPMLRRMNECAIKNRKQMTPTRYHDIGFLKMIKPRIKMIKAFCSGQELKLYDGE